MKPDPAAEGARWFAQAEHDLDDARYSREGGRFNLACFMAQQSAEKGVKAFLYRKGRTLVTGHSVADLLEDAAKLEPSFEKLVADGTRLDRMYIPTRYPNGLPGGVPSDSYFDDDARDMIAAAERILAAVRKHVS